MSNHTRRLQVILHKKATTTFSLWREISPNLYPMKVYRVLARHDLNRLPNELTGAERKIRKFRKYGIGYLHIDLLYAP